MVRVKNRYLVIEVVQRHRSTFNSLNIKSTPLHTCIFRMVQTLHGDFGIAATSNGFQAKYCNEKTNIAVIKCRFGPHRIIASSLPFIKAIDQNTATINIIYVGATIKKCFGFIQKYQQQIFDKYCVNLETEEDKEQLRQALIKAEDVMKMG